MATFVFKAMDLAGVPAKGEVEALSKQDVADQLKQRGLVVVDIVQKYRSKELNIELLPHVKPAQLAVMTRQLATMVTSGMPILRCLYVLESQAENKLLRTTLAGVRADVEAGLLLSDALARYPKVFNPLYVAMVRAGEAGGVLDDRHAIVAPLGWDRYGRTVMQSLVPEPLVLEDDEALQFCANSVVVDRTIVMPACPPRVGKQLEAWGFDVVVTPMSEFLKAGGGCRCLTLALDVTLG